MLRISTTLIALLFAATAADLTAQGTKGVPLRGKGVAQGTKGILKRGTYIDAAHGYKVKVPAKWGEVPTKVDEKWIVAQFQCNREYEGHHKLDFSAFHKPVMRVIMFDEEVIKKTKYTEKAGSTTVTRLKLPYRDYKDYVKRNLSKGGFFFQKEAEGKQGKLDVVRYQVVVQKMARRGRMTYDAWVYRGQGVHFAVEFEYLTHHYKKLKRSGDRCFKTFKFIERTAAVEDPQLVSTSSWVRADWKKLKPKDRHDKRKAIAEHRIKQAINDLPKGWVVKETKHFVILSHASKKYTGRVLRAVECCRQWLEDRVGGVTPEYVTRGVVRICKTADEMNLYMTGSGDAFNADSREVVAYENKGAGTGGAHGNLFFGIYNQFLYDKDEYLYWHIPAWMDYAFMNYFSTAQLKGKSLQFKTTVAEKNAFREMRRRKIKVLNPKELMHVTTELMIKGDNSNQFTSYQILRFLRFLEGPGKKYKLFKKRDFVEEYMKETIVQAEDYIDKHPNVRRVDDASTEEEEEKQANASNKYEEIRRTKIVENINKVVCKWTDKQWKDLEDTYFAWSKKQ